MYYIRDNFQLVDTQALIEEFERTPYSTFVIQYPPYITPEKIPGSNNKRQYQLTQYAKTLATNWPFEYKLEGKWINDFIESYVFDTEFTIQKDQF